MALRYPCCTDIPVLCLICCHFAWKIVWTIGGRVPVLQLATIVRTLQQARSLFLTLEPHAIIVEPSYLLGESSLHHREREGSGTLCLLGSEQESMWLCLLHRCMVTCKSNLLLASSTLYMACSCVLLGAIPWYCVCHVSVQHEPNQKSISWLPAHTYV
jgi:hypothetical protein